MWVKWSHGMLGPHVFYALAVEIVEMIAALYSVASLMISVALLQLGTGLYLTFLSLRMDLEGFSDPAIGAVGSAYFGGFVIGALYCDRYIHKVGHVRSYLGFGAFACAAVMSHSWLIEPVYWALLRFIAGVVSSGLFMVVESWLNERADQSNRGSIFSGYLVINYVALGGGQFLINAADPAGPQLFLLIGTLFALSLTPMAFSQATVPAPYERRSFGVRRLFAISPLGVIGCLVIGLTNGAFYVLTPIFATRLGFDTATVSTLLAGTILSGLVMQWPLGKLSDRFDRRSILILVAVATCAMAAAIAFNARDGVIDDSLLLALICGYGAFVYAIYPLAVSHANDYADAEDIVPLTAGLLLAYGTGALIGPFAASATTALVGPSGLYFYIAAVTGGLAVFGLLRMKLRDTVAVDDQGPFMALPRTSPVVVSEMNPLADWEEEQEEEAETEAEK